MRASREIMLFIGKPKGRSRMISNAPATLCNSHMKIDDVLYHVSGETKYGLIGITDEGGQDAYVECMSNLATPVIKAEIVALNCKN